LTVGQAQMFSIGDTKVLGATTVNEFHVGLIGMRITSASRAAAWALPCSRKAS
jgi:hypothetical protein